MNTNDRYARYERLAMKRHPDGILEIVMGAPGKLSTADHVLHRELAEVWLDVDKDPDTRVAILRGEGKGFSAGGDMKLIEGMIDHFDTRARVWREARDLVYNVINCSKPIVSAIRGPAVGAGLVAGVLADVSIASKKAKIVDGHTRLGVAAGDHSVIVWPLLCGMAQAKYYLLLCEPIDGARAAEIGLVTMCVEDEDLEAKSLEVATKLATGAQSAIRFTKYSLNNWYRMAGPSFDTSLALEMLGFKGPEVAEGLKSHLEKRPPSFPESSPI